MSYLVEAGGAPEPRAYHDLTRALKRVEQLIIAGCPAVTITNETKV